MAESKGNRKKGKKRQEVRRRPVSETQLKAQQKAAESEAKEMSRLQNFSFLALIVMVVGFVLIIMNYHMIGYPITFVGALASAFLTPEDMKHRKLSIAGCILYMVMVAFLWFTELGGGGSPF